MELLSSETTRWVVAAWFLFLGGAVGSFLNVVVYRLPAGMSISWPGSHCPRCKHSIRAYDNVPVLAWLWLRGRCRDCGERISIRYPMVEAVTSGLFLLLFIVEVLHDGQNLPFRMPDGPRSYPPVQTLCICLFHLGLLCTLMAAGLIRWDGRQPTRWLFAPMLLIGFLTPPIWPWLHPLPAGPGVADSPWGGVVDSLLGFGTALFLGRIAEWLGERFARMGKPGNQILGQALVIGVVLGWQAVFALVPLTMLLEELSHIAAARWSLAHRFMAAVWIAPLALFWILNWVRLAAWLRLG
ncbi:MAG: prepilin peptidase [Thermoguttaceae bacterium]|jgi:prepilin signal peptidase PulO-like enzyme (type II secretory pathway)